MGSAGGVASTSMSVYGASGEPTPGAAGVPIIAKASGAMRILADAIPAKFWDAHVSGGTDPDNQVIDYNDANSRTFPQMIKWFERAVKAD